MGFLPDFSVETWTRITVVVALLAVYVFAPYGLFKKLGIQGPTPLPFIGTFWGNLQGVTTFDIQCHQKYGRMWGLYDGRQPVLATMDTGMIKTVLVKECYSAFTNRRNVGLNGPLSDALTVLEDEEWKRIRSILSPSFTSGRLKEMYPIMLKHSSNLIKSLRKKGPGDEIVEVKELFGPYSMDIVSSTSFSVDVDSINHPSDSIVTNLKKLATFNFTHPLILLVVLFPFLMPLFEKMNLSIFPAEQLDFFYNFLKKIKSERHKNEHKSRVDFMQLMVDSQISDDSSSQKGLTDHEILSQALLYIFAGYDTTSSSLGFLAYNLATNPQVQKALQEEIDKTFPAKGQPSYDALIQMEYLDMVLNESMRLFPVGSRIERMTKTSVEVNGISIPKGTIVMVPVYPLHRDPTLWSEPDVFKPERFSKDNKDDLDPYAYLPFGAGPRNCIGMRFAVLTMKLAIVEILQNFSFLPCKDTEIPLTLGNGIFASPKNPIKLTLRPRETTE